MKLNEIALRLGCFLWIAFIAVSVVLIFIETSAGSKKEDGETLVAFYRRNIKRITILSVVSFVFGTATAFCFVLACIAR